MKIAILHTRISGYFVACLRELKAQANADLLIIAWPNQADAPFDDSLIADIGTVFSRRDHGEKSIIQKLSVFQPDAVLVSGWADKGYVKVCQKLKRKGIPIIAGCDTQWKGSLRQNIAKVVAPWHVHKFIDVLWVSGERQRQLAEKLGFVGQYCWDGYYACDWDLFAHESRKIYDVTESYANKDQSFLFVGRYAPEKGLDTLAEAYRMYCTKVEKPWKLLCAGKGAYSQSLIEVGAEDRGFVQPEDLPGLLAEASAFILPSRFEPWGVVLQEAAASGLPLIASDVCGAGVHLLRDRWNGRSFYCGDVNQLAECLLWFHDQPEGSLSEMGKNSFELSKQYTPERWVWTLTDGLSRLKRK